MNYYNNLSFLRNIAEFQDLDKFNSSNGHMFYLMFKNKKLRDFFLQVLIQRGVQSTFHYIPLHITNFGKKVGKKKFDLPVTEAAYNRLLRLPLWYNLKQTKVIRDFKQIYQKISKFKNI
jgi:dTDP-4-amino-4,6-dideoxygalactose transaminase